MKTRFWRGYPYAKKGLAVVEMEIQKRMHRFSGKRIEKRCWSDCMEPLHIGIGKLLYRAETWIAACTTPRYWDQQ